MSAGCPASELARYDNNYFTAAEARELAGTTVEERVKLLLVRIKELATEKKHQCRTGHDYNVDEELWINGGYSRTIEWTEARKILESLGFKVTFYYQEMSIAVDMYTLIEW